MRTYDFKAICELLFYITQVFDVTSFQIISITHLINRFPRVQKGQIKIQSTPT